MYVEIEFFFHKHQQGRIPNPRYDSFQQYHFLKLTPPFPSTTPESFRSLVTRSQCLLGPFHSLPEPVLPLPHKVSNSPLLPEPFQDP